MSILENVKCDLTPIVQSLAGIMDSCHKGVVKLVAVAFSRRHAEAIRDVMLRDAQNHRDADDIAKGLKRYETGKLVDCGIIGAVGEGILDDEVTNFIKTLKETAKLLENLSPNAISDEPVQKTFFNRWRKEVELVDDDQLRTLWAKIMAQEIIDPGSIAPRTLDVLRNMSSEDAKLYEKMVRGEFAGIIPVYDNGHPQYVSYSDALKLQDAGVVFAQQSCRTFDQTYKIDDKKKGCAFVLEPHKFMVCVEKEKYEVRCYLLTDAGKSLLHIAQGRRNIKDFIDILSRLAKENTDVVLSLHQIIEDDDQQIRWKSMPLWSSRTSSGNKGNV